MAIMTPAPGGEPTLPQEASTEAGADHHGSSADGSISASQRQQVPRRRSHPAPFPRYVLDRLGLYVRAEARALRRPARVLDSFAGIGRIHDLKRRYAETTGVELEPEWACWRARTVVGDATALPAEWTASFDVWATSPCYGNRLADHHEAKDSCAGCGGTGSTWNADGCAEAPMICPACHDIACVCGVLAKEMREHNARCQSCRGRRCAACGGTGVSRRYTYRHALGRMPTEGSAAVFNWTDQGGKYRAVNGRAVEEARRCLADGALALVNVKNHLRQDAEQPVVEWWARRMGDSGFTVTDIVGLDAPGLRHAGANGEARIDYERIIVGRAT